MEALHAIFYGKIKSRKMSLGKEDKKTRLSKITNVLQCDASPGRQTLRGLGVPLVCSFIRLISSQTRKIRIHGKKK